MTQPYPAGGLGRGAVSPPTGSGARLFFRGTHNVRDDLQLSHFGA